MRKKGLRYQKFGRKELLEIPKRICSTIWRHICVKVEL